MLKFPMTAEELEIICTQPHKSETMTDLCQYYGALFFSQEKSYRGSDYTSCCNKGSFSIPALSSCPPTLRELYAGNGPLSVQFRQKIRYINSIFAMASFETSRPMPERRGQGHWSFTVCGQIYHNLDPIPNTEYLR